MNAIEPMNIGTLATLNTIPNYVYRDKKKIRCKGWQGRHILTAAPMLTIGNYQADVEANTNLFV